MAAQMGMERAWSAVRAEAARLRKTNLRALFAADAGRFAGFSAALDDLTLDFSKEKIDAPALDALLALARAARVEAKRDAMAAGEAVNCTEARPALHMSLRGSVAPPVAGVEEVGPTRERFLAFAEAVRSGAYAGAGGAFTDVVSIGIGGSDLGPAMATQALAPDADGPRVHFVSNVDGAHLSDALAGLDPARTLVLIASKTFTTLETMTNAAAARDWLRAALGALAPAHMAAVSSNIPACAAFGVPEARVFGFWDWVGGRYSVWSAVGLPLAIAVGAVRFREFLAGAAAMDRHFLTAPLACNLPVLYGLVGVWRRNAMGWPTAALIPYDQRLARFSAYIQQLDMESNGKRMRCGGVAVAQSSGPVVWGEPGSSAQHSFFQLIHQGSDVTPVDFIAAAAPRAAPLKAHDILLANCLAQAQALAFGRTAAEARMEMTAAGLSPVEVERLAPHKTFPGDRPSTVLLHRRLDAFALGRLIALYEHKVFVQAAIWDVNPFDQWGVELGKALAGPLIPAVGRGEAKGADASTAGLLARIRELRA